MLFFNIGTSRHRAKFGPRGLQLHWTRGIVETKHVDMAPWQHVSHSATIINVMQIQSSASMTQLLEALLHIITMTRCGDTCVYQIAFPRFPLMYRATSRSHG
jgi:hypothetical protein